MGRWPFVLLLVLPLGVVAQAGMALHDPCHATSGVIAVGSRVCVEGRTASESPSVVAVIASGEHAGVRFVAFAAEGVGRLALVSRSPGTWSDPLPVGPQGPLPALHEEDGPGGPYRLVRLHTPMLPEWHASLLAHGVTVHGFVPPATFLVHGDAGPLAELPFVAHVTGLSALGKLEPGLLEEDGPRLVNVLTVPSGPGAREEVLATLAALGATVVHDAPEVERITALVPAGRLLDLAMAPGVLWVDRASLSVGTDMDIVRAMTGASALAALDAPFTGEGVVGEVMDVGLEAAHQDFAALLAVDGPNVADAHGTGVFGIVFGSGQGDARARGVAPSARGVFASAHSGESRFAHAARLVEEWGGVFQTHSWGREVPRDGRYDSHANENDRIVADLGVTLLQSMGNCGSSCARREAMAKNILSIGGMYHFDTEETADDRWAHPFREGRPSTGPTADGRTKPDLVGPFDLVHTTTTGNGYHAAFGGTSAATPVIAGAVALVNEMHAKGAFAGSVGAPMPATVKALLLASATPYAPSQVLDASRLLVDPPMGRSMQGWGMLDLASLQSSARDALVIDETMAIATGEAVSFRYVPPPGARFIRICLTWTDVPAHPAAFNALVNDLDLEVLDEHARVLYKGNVGLDFSPMSLPGGQADRLNNVELVAVPRGAGEALVITVRGAAINLDATPSSAAIDQDFALVALGLN